MQASQNETKISVVIVYTNEEQLSEAVKYLEAQSVFPSTELILLDNRKNRFSSAASALNYGAEKANGEVIVFMHQDIYLWDDKFLEKYYNFLHNHANAILGVAGVAKKDHLIYYDFCESKDRIYRGRSSRGELMQAITLDECLFAMQKDLWKKLKFDEDTCNNWHFYGADICYNNLLNGGENLILSAQICHESKGNAYNKSFRHSLKLMIKKYRKKLERMETTCINIKCNSFMYFIYATVSRFKEMTRRKKK
ncbi:MAG: glycosyltransferase family protein [Clostridia bacterium]|nr:glycosyltransferase family protein [Clostridia bacterium]